MMKTILRSAFRTGLIFGTVLIFLVLIGFQGIAADLLGGLFNDSGASLGNLTAGMCNMMLFFILIGIWAGMKGYDKKNTTRWTQAMAGSATCSAAAGLCLGILAFILGIFLANNIKVNVYLSELLPATIQTFTLGAYPITAGLTYFITMTVSGLLGGLISFGLSKVTWWASIKQFFTALQTKIQNQAWAKSKYFPAIFYGLLILLIFLIPLKLNANWIYTAGTVGIYVLLGLGLNIVVGLAGLLDLGYVAFFAIGAYTTALLTAAAPLHMQWSFWATVPIGIVLAACAGILLGIPVLRMRGDYLAIVTMGFGEIIRILISSDLLKNFTGGPAGVPGVGQPTLFGHSFNSGLDYLYMILLGVFLVIFITNRLKNSRIGRAWESMREDETVAQAMGIDTLRYKLLAFATGAAFAGLGGALFAARNQFTGPEDHVLMVSINVLCLVIVGGMGSIPGVIAGAFVLKGLPEVLRQLQDYRQVAFGALLVIMMILRPEGLIPSSRRRMELHKEEVDENPPEQVDVEGLNPSENAVTK